MRKIEIMYLISCDNCGVVLDGNKLPFPSDIYNDDGSVNEHAASWNGNGFVPKTKCPVCGEEVLKRISQTR